MKKDPFGRSVCDEKDLVSAIYGFPDLDFSNIVATGDALEKYQSSLKKYFLDWPVPVRYNESVATVAEFDALCQSNWYMPNEYKNLDIAEWLLDRCETQDQLQRVGKELLMFQERDSLDLLRFLKYLVDTLRANQVVWGVGRGSSVASYVLYLIGVHKIDSMYYDLDVEEFLR